MPPINPILLPQDNLGQLRHAVEASLKDETLIWPSAEEFKAANNIADLDSNGLIPITEIPIDELKDYFAAAGLFLGYYETEAALRTAHPTAEAGNYAIVGTTDTIWIWDADTTSWVDSGSTGGAVLSVNGKTGEVVLTKTDVGLGNVNNTADLNKPISTATQTALDAKADKSAVNTLNTKVTALETTVGDETSGLVKAVNDKQDKLSAAQLLAVNSGITSAKVTTYDGYGTSKQNKTDNSLETTSKTIVGAINEVKAVNDSQATSINNLQSQLNLEHPTNTIPAFVITPVSNTTGVSITAGSGAAAAGKGGKVIVSPTITNVGAIYVTTEATKPTALPLYPNTVVEFGPYTDLSDVLIYVDSLGDSTSVQINYV